MVPQRRPGGTGHGEGLQVLGGLLHCRQTQDVYGRPHGSVGAGDKGRGDQEFRHVLGQPSVAGGVLGEAEVDEYRAVFGIDEDVRQPQVAVRDPCRAQSGHLRPYLAQAAVVHRSVFVGTGIYRLFDEQPGARASRCHADDRGDACARGRRAHQHVRLVLDLAFGARHRRLVLDLAVEEEAGRLEQQVRVALVTAERLDEDGAAVAGDRSEGNRAAGIGFERLGDRLVQAAACEPGSDLRRRGDVVRGAACEVDGAADRPAEGRPGDDVEGKWAPT